MTPDSALAPATPVSAIQARRTAILLTALVGMGALSIDMFLPSLPAMAEEFRSPAATAQLTVTLFIAGLAVAQLMFGPLSDRLGRRPVLLAGMALYTAAGWVCWLAPNMNLLIAARVLQGLGAGSGPVLGRAIVRDLYGPQRGARVLAYISTAHGVTPVLAPMLGGWLATAFGWHSVFLVLAGFGALFATLAVLLVPESLAVRDPAALNPRKLGGNVRELLSNPRFVGFVAVVTITFCGQFAFISGSSYVLITVIGVSPEVYGLCFGTVALGIMAGSFTAGRLSRRLGIRVLILGGTATCAAAGATLAALAVWPVVSVWAIVLPMIGYAVGVGLVLPTAQAGAIGPYPRMAGLASALLGFLMLMGTAGYGVAVGTFIDGTTRPMAVAIALAGASALLAFWLLLRPDERAEQRPA